MALLTRRDLTGREQERQPGLMTPSGYEPGRLKAGQYYAEGPGGQYSNVREYGLPDALAPQRQPDMAKLARIGREFRTREQAADLRRIAKARAKLDAFRSRVDRKSLTMQARQRLEQADQSRLATQEARQQAQQNALARLDKRFGEPARLQAEAAKAQTALQAEAAKQQAALTREGFQNRMDIERLRAETAEQKQKRQAEERAVQERINQGRATARDVQMRTRQLDDGIGRLNIQIAQATANATRDPDANNIVEALEELRQVKEAEKERLAGSLPQAVPGEATGGGVGVDSNGNEIPDNLESFIGEIVRREASGDPAVQQTAIMGRQKMRQLGISEEAINKAIKAYKNAQG